MATVQNTELFITAIRQNYLFPILGAINIIDVFRLPLKARPNRDEPSLNELAQTLQDRLDALPKRNFVDDNEDGDEDNLAAKLEIVKEVIAIKKAESKAAESAVVNAGKLRELDSLIAARRSEELAKTPLEELEAQRAALLGAAQ